MATGLKAVLRPIRHAFNEMTESDAIKSAVLYGQDADTGFEAGVKLGVKLKSKIDVKGAVKTGANVADADVTDITKADAAKADAEINVKSDVKSAAKVDAVEFDAKSATERGAERVAIETRGFSEGTSTDALFSTTHNFCFPSLLLGAVTGVISAFHVR